MSLHQLIIGNLKLLTEYDDKGLSLELTDFSTDISWLSGRQYFHISYGSDFPKVNEYKVDRMFIAHGGQIFSGIAGLLRVEYSLIPGWKPHCLQETITLLNHSAFRVRIDEIRIGLTWTPPFSWWRSDSNWKLVTIPMGFHQSLKSSLGVVQSFGSLVDKPAKKKIGLEPKSIPFGGGEARGWVISDDRRFLVIIKVPLTSTESCLIDIFQMKKQPPSLIMGGIGWKGKNQDFPEGLEPEEAWISDSTIFIPGAGGIREGLVALDEYLTQAD